MKLQRRFAPTGGEFAPESVARFIGIRICRVFLEKIEENLNNYRTFTLHLRRYRCWHSVK